MGKSVNKVMLMGNLGQDPELRQAGETSVCNLRLATNERRKVGGEWEDHVEWHSITVWGNSAEAICKHLKKGSGLFVEGRLQTRKWQDKDGNDRYTTEIVADNTVFVGGGKDRDDNGDSEPAKTKSKSSGGGKKQQSSQDDDLPYG